MISSKNRGEEHMLTVILGIGNELLGDEGVGVHALRILRDEELPDQIRCVEAGTAILEILPDLEEADRIIILDAMKDGHAPGTVYRIPFAECSGAPCIASMHGFDIFRVMALAGRSVPPPTVVFGVEPEQISWSMQLSPPVTEAMPHLLDAVRRELFS